MFHNNWYSCFHRLCLLCSCLNLYMYSVWSKNNSIHHWQERFFKFYSQDWLYICCLTLDRIIADDYKLSYLFAFFFFFNKLSQHLNYFQNTCGLPCNSRNNSHINWSVIWHKELLAISGIYLKHYFSWGFFSFTRCLYSVSQSNIIEKIGFDYLKVKGYVFEI